MAAKRKRTGVEYFVGKPALRFDTRLDFASPSSWSSFSSSASREHQLRSARDSLLRDRGPSMYLEERLASRVVHRSGACGRDVDVAPCPSSVSP